ncbi:uncharacterized protein LOC128716009 [Anopheles marshallii]|uniref:uncharacterized protein LOC128716009 n=1 Tax=Anopheles marshallii TaxID=1521116 RepID=UPI00237A30F9|nr:uncharacterized protein LOC128716009 [Anopheles marshallii]
MKQVCILLAVLLCTAAVADGLVLVYASTCARCNSIGSFRCGTGYGHMVSCVGQTAISSCADCRRGGGYCSDHFITDCFL